MKLLPLERDERVRIACFPDELDEVLAWVTWLFAGRAIAKVAIHQGVAIVVVKGGKV